MNQIFADIVNQHFPGLAERRGTMYVYKKTEEQLWTVGFYAPNGKFEPESDHDNSEDAATRVAWLNGGGK